MVLLSTQSNGTAIAISYITFFTCRFVSKIQTKRIKSVCNIQTHQTRGRGSADIRNIGSKLLKKWGHKEGKRLS